MVREGILACYRQRVQKRFGDMVCDSNLEMAVSRVAEFMYEWFSKWNVRGKGLMLIGGVGNGKTTMLHAIGDYIGEVLDTASPYVTMTEKHPVFWKAQAIAMEATRDKGVSFDDIKRANVLMVDDFGAEATEVMRYGMPLCPMEDVLGYRYDNMLPTFCSTNLSLQNLFGHTDEVSGERVKGKYPDPRLLDRAKEMFEIIVFKGGSYR